MLDWDRMLSNLVEEQKNDRAFVAKILKGVKSQKIEIKLRAIRDLEKLGNRMAIIPLVFILQNEVTKVQACIMKTLMGLMSKEEFNLFTDFLIGEKQNT